MSRPTGGRWRTVDTGAPNRYVVPVVALGKRAGQVRAGDVRRTGCAIVALVTYWAGLLRRRGGT